MVEMKVQTNKELFTIEPWPKVMERMRRLRARISNNDSAHRYKSGGVDVFMGNGTVSPPDRIEVDGKTLRFSKAVIATGARAAAPPIPGLKEVSLTDDGGREDIPTLELHGLLTYRRLGS